MDLADLSAGTFEPHERSTFVLAPSGGEPFNATLTEIRLGGPGPVREQFALLFVGGPTPPAPQGIFTVAHEELGTMDAFLVPLGPGPDGQRYEAVFS